MERSELLDRLVPLIPPPRAHQIRYHGIRAPGASQRDRVVPGAVTLGPRDGSTDRDRAATAQEAEAPRERDRRMRWAALLQRVLEVAARRCPCCGSTLRLVAAIEDPWIAQKILACPDLPARAPPLVPAAAEAPGLGSDDDFDQSPVYEDP